MESKGREAVMSELHCTLRTLLDCTPMEIASPILWILGLAILFVIVAQAMRM